MTDINNLGSFDSIDEVWSRYPEGGNEGDYLTVDGVKYRWNKYDRIWENADTVTESPARRDHTIYGNLKVHHDLTVAGTLYAKHVKQPNRGLFATLEELKSAIPDPEVGMWAAVGNTVPAPIYYCITPGEWKATGGVGGVDAEDGLTPYIGDNGHWWIGDTDTGVLARGTSGKDGTPGRTPVLTADDDGNIYVDGKLLTDILAEARKILSDVGDTVKEGATLEDAKEALAALGENYKDIYSVAHTLKAFLEVGEDVDTTIESWYKIEEFLQGITDTDSLTELLFQLENNITSAYNSAVDKEKQRATQAEKGLDTRLKEIEDKLPKLATSEALNNVASTLAQTITGFEGFKMDMAAAITGLQGEIPTAGSVVSSILSGYLDDMINEMGKQDSFGEAIKGVVDSKYITDAVKQNIEDLGIITGISEDRVNELIISGMENITGLVYREWLDGWMGDISGALDGWGVGTLRELLQGFITGVAQTTNKVLSL